MTELILDASPRTDHGKGAMRKLRQKGQIPAIVYGLQKPVSIQLEEMQLSKLVQQLHGSERMITLRIEDGEGKKKEEKNVLLKEVQTRPVGQVLLHVDFQEIDVSRTVHVTVELRPVGSSVGVILGGILQAVKHDVVVECLPDSIPEYIEADVSDLNIGDSLHVKEIPFPEGIKPITGQDETLIVISAPRVEEVEEEEVPEEELAAEEGEEAAESPETEPEKE